MSSLEDVEASATFVDARAFESYTALIKYLKPKRQ